MDPMIPKFSPAAFLNALHHKALLMKTITSHLTAILLLLTIAANSEVAAQTKPLKVYILCGQSNMQGHAQTKTLAHLAMDPATASMLADIQDKDGTAKVFNNIWISSLGSAPEIRQGNLTTGFGAAGRGQTKIGPELTFGIYMQKHVKEPILIIKTAWGGKSLHTDFRPPSAGPYSFTEQELKRMQDQGKDVKAVMTARKAATGGYYRNTIQHVKAVLADIKKVYPSYDQDAGYELAGFVWFQGWNDMVARDVYPNRDQPGGYAKYGEVLATFIRDVRKDLQAAKMPFVIGVMGTGGPVAKYGPNKQRYVGTHSGFRKAMAAPASLPEFQGNVTTVLTENSWDLQLTELVSRREQLKALERKLKKDGSNSKDKIAEAVQQLSDELFTAEELKILEVGVSNAEYHYLGSAKILCGIGKAFADALADMK